MSPMIRYQDICKQLFKYIFRWDFFCLFSFPFICLFLEAIVVIVVTITFSSIRCRFNPDFFGPNERERKNDTTCIIKHTVYWVCAHLTQSKAINQSSVAHFMCPANGSMTHVYVFSGLLAGELHFLHTQIYTCDRVCAHERNGTADTHTRLNNKRKRKKSNK